MPEFDVKDGRLLTWSFEAHVVDHRNLSCRNCSSLSPQHDERVMAVETLARDLERVRGAIRPNVFKVTGGEPLLHPDIAGCLEAIREADVADAIQVTTNGHLIKRVSESFWEAVDRLAVSYYTSAPLAKPLQDYIRRRAEDHGVELEVKCRETFHVMDVEPPGQSDATTRRVYDECWLKSRCHMVYDGRFYKCTRPPHLMDRYSDREDVELVADEEGVVLAGERLAERIRAYLETDEPLDSCRYCRGTSGERVEHRQS